MGSCSLVVCLYERFLFVAFLCFCVAGVSYAQVPPTPTPPVDTQKASDSSTPPAAAVTAYQRGVDAFKAGNLSAAVTEMRAAVRENPQDPAAQRWLGFLLVRAKDPVNAIPHLEKAISLLNATLKNPKTSPKVAAVAKSDLADTYAHLGDALLSRPQASSADVARAVEAFRSSAQRNPSSALAFYNLGYAYTRAGRYEDSAKAYRKSIALAPRDERVWRTWSGLGFALQKLGASRFPEAAEAYREAATRKPDEPSLWVSLGTLQMERGPAMRGSAISALETARKLNSQDYAATVTLARAYAEADRFEEAAMLYQEAAALPEAKNPQIQATLLYNRGVVLARAKKLSDSQSSYERALGLKPQYFDALINLGFVLFEQKQYDDAVARLRQALTLKPDSYLAWSNLGAALAQKKDIPGATTAWRKAAQIEPKNYTARAVLADLLMQQQRYDEAIAVYRQMAVLQPASALPMNAMGLAYQKKNDTEGAFAAFREAVRREPRNAAARNNLGVLYEKKGDFTAAIREYKNALVLEPGFTDARANLQRFGAQAATIAPSITPAGSRKSTSESGGVPTKPGGGQ